MLEDLERLERLEVKVCVDHEFEPRRANQGQLGPNLSTLDPPRISRAPKRVFRGPNEPFLPVFSSWVVPYGL